MLWLWLFVPPVPGALCTKKHHDFAETRYIEQIPICKRSVSTKRKNAICRRDGITDRREYTVDHVIPLSLGGDNSNANLWCQHKSVAVTDLEYLLYRQLSSGEITHNAAVRIIKRVKFDDRTSSLLQKSFNQHHD